jgi:hypothetical protein
MPDQNHVQSPHLPGSPVPLPLLVDKKPDDSTTLPVSSDKDEQAVWTEIDQIAPSYEDLDELWKFKKSKRETA